MANALQRDPAPKDEPVAQPLLTPGAQLLADQTADLVLRILPPIDSITVTGAVYEYHEGFGRIQRDGEPPLQVPAHVLLRIEAAQATNGGAGRLPVWTWRDKRRLVVATLCDSDARSTLVMVPYTDPNDLEHMVMFRRDESARAAFLDESSEVLAAIARRTLTTLKTMVLALDSSPLATAARVRDLLLLHLQDHEVRTQAASDRLRLVDADLPLDIHEPRQFTTTVEQLQRMLAFTEDVVFQESAIVSAAVRAMFTEVQGRRGSGWRRWRNGTAHGTYSGADGTATSVDVAVLVYHDRDRGALHVVEPAPRNVPGKGTLVTGWPIRSLDAARLLTECDQIVGALTEEWEERRHSLAGKVSGAVHRLPRLRA